MTLETKSDCVEFLAWLSKAEKEVFPGYAKLIFKMSESLSESNLTEEISISEIKDFLIKEVSKTSPSGNLTAMDIHVAKSIAEDIEGFSKVDEILRKLNHATNNN